MTGVARALMLSTSERYFALVVSFATIAALSRILTPAEIGVSVIGTAIIGITITVREFASAGFLIQSKNLGRDDIRGAFTVMQLLMAAVAMLLALGAPLLARIYEQAGMVTYLRLLCACLVIDQISYQIITLLRRDMQFGRIAIINVTAAGIGSAITIFLALNGFSFMSFAWSWLATTIISVVMALMFRPHFWMFKPSLHNWRGVLAFGGYNGSTVLLFKMSEQLPYLLLGRTGSPDTAAMFSRGLMICQLPDKVLLGGAVSVVLPAFAAEARTGRSLKPPYLNGLSLITALLWPAHLVLALLAYPVVDILLGDQWHEVVPLVQIMAVASLFSFSFELNYPVLVSVGAIRDVFFRALIVFPISAAAITSAALFGGLHATAWSMMFIVPFHAYVSLYFVRRRLCLSWLEIGSAIWKSGFVAAASTLGPVAVYLVSGFDLRFTVVEAIAAGSLAGLAWLAGLWITRHSLLTEILRVVAGLRGALGYPATDRPVLADG